MGRGPRAHEHTWAAAHRGIPECSISYPLHNAFKRQLLKEGSSKEGETSGLGTGASGRGRRGDAGLRLAPRSSSSSAIQLDLQPAADASSVPAPTAQLIFLKVCPAPHLVLDLNFDFKAIPAPWITFSFTTAASLRFPPAPPLPLRSPPRLQAGPPPSVLPLSLEGPPWSSLGESLPAGVPMPSSSSPLWAGPNLWTGGQGCSDPDASPPTTLPEPPSSAACLPLHFNVN